MAAKANRYLTPAEKRDELSRWQEYMRTHPPVGPADKGGSGHQDGDIVPICNALNALDGVCTVQSCAGHGYQDGDVFRVLSSGVLWLRLDGDMSTAFDRDAFTLAQHSLMEQVERRYHPGGREIIVVAFRGNERGCLPSSARVILEFFARLRRAA